MKRFFYIGFIILMVALSGCGNQQFQKTYSNYQRLYVSSMAFINDGSFATKENPKKLQKVDLERLEKNIITLKELQDQLKGLAKTRYEKNIAQLAYVDRIDLDIILDIRKRIDSLSDDDIWNLSYACISISAAIDGYNEGK